MGDANTNYLPNHITRRDFLKWAALSIGGLSVSPWKKLFKISDFPQAERLGRVCEGRVFLKNRPNLDSDNVGILYEDAVVPWIQEVVGRNPARFNQRWVKTPEGYIWSPYLQPVENQPNNPMRELPKFGDETGMWVEVTVPYVDAILDNPPTRSRWLQYRIENGLGARFYYSQIHWVDQIKTDEDGFVWYRVNERYGNPGDIFWVPGEAFRPITEMEMSPIHPNVENKRVVIDVNPKVQSLSCYEGNTEVYYCHISSGEMKDSTPISPPGTPGYPIWRKLYSVHMAGGTNAAGWDLPGIGWTSLFVGNGVAIHSTYWHNIFGSVKSNGCVNAKPKDAKWIFRWVRPEAPFETGDVTIVGEGSTRVIVNHW